MENTLKLIKPLIFVVMPIFAVALLLLLTSLSLSSHIWSDIIAVQSVKSCQRSFPKHFCFVLFSSVSALEEEKSESNFIWPTNKACFLVTTPSTCLIALL